MEKLKKNFVLTNLLKDFYPKHQNEILSESIEHNERKGKKEFLNQTEQKKSRQHQKLH